jgi:uncharacterized protein
MDRWLELADWRECVARLYLAEPRQGEAGLAAFREGREQLFRQHPQSPLEAGQRAGLAGLPWFPYSPAARVTTRAEPLAEGEELAIDTGGEDGTVRYRRIARLATPYGSLTLYWTLGYGGGLFLPFRDATAGGETYGAGRYLTDTIRSPAPRAASWSPSTRSAPTRAPASSCACRSRGDRRYPRHPRYPHRRCHLSHP